VGGGGCGWAWVWVLVEGVDRGAGGIFLGVRAGICGRTGGFGRGWVLGYFSGVGGGVVASFWGDL